MKDNEAELTIIHEHLRLSLDAPEGACSICHMEPTGNKLILGLTERGGDDERTVTVCRHCLSEFAPNLLAELESEL